jgi:hypothetical protein
MAVTNSPNNSTKNVLELVRSLLPNAVIKEAKSFYWSPDANTIAFSSEKLKTAAGQWSLLHEAAHAYLEHTVYKNDFELLKMEVAAWEEAKIFSLKIKIKIDEDHIQDCLDTYRDWLHRRSTCPTCGNAGLQQTRRTYHCHNCLTKWEVTHSRFCRPYRRKHTSSNEKSPHLSGKTTFR